MSEIEGLSQLAVNLATLAAILYTLWKMLKASREAMAARVAATEAALRAEAAAQLASDHAKETSIIITAVADKVGQVEIATNGMREALVKAAGEAGEVRGREAEVARREEDKK